jgi:hypothetical protein
MIAAPALVALSRPLDKVAPLARVGANDAPGSPSREWWSYFASYDDRAIISCVFLFLLSGYVSMVGESKSIVIAGPPNHSPGTSQ